MTKNCVHAGQRPWPLVWWARQVRHPQAVGGEILNHLDEHILADETEQSYILKEAKYTTMLKTEKYCTNSSSIHCVPARDTVDLSSLPRVNKVMLPKADNNTLQWRPHSLDYVLGVVQISYLRYPCPFIHQQIQLFVVLVGEYCYWNQLGTDSYLYKLLGGHIYTVEVFRINYKLYLDT